MTFVLGLYFCINGYNISKIKFATSCTPPIIKNTIQKKPNILDVYIYYENRYISVKLIWKSNGCKFNITLLIRNYV